MVYFERNSYSNSRGHAISRRRAICSGAGAIVSAAAAVSVMPLSVVRAATTAAAEKTIPIIDTHQHLWNLKEQNLSWLGGAPEILKKSYWTAEYLAATEGLGIASAVYMEVDIAEAEQGKEADTLIALCRAKNSPTVAAVISGRPNQESFEKYIRGYSVHPEIKGVRQVLHAAEAVRGLCLQPQFVKSMKLLGELGLSFDLCMRPAELSDAVQLAKACPETRFVLDHCGNADPEAFMPESKRSKKLEHTADQWKRDLVALAECQNAICKISGVIASAPAGIPFAESLAPIVNFCLDTFGPDRVVFGGDWPVCLLGGTYRDWVLALREIIAARPERDREKLWNGNARRFYRLEA
jgi:L-fuconolactonase